MIYLEMASTSYFQEQQEEQRQQMEAESRQFPELRE
jgi:hypothetical protein